MSIVYLIGYTCEQIWRIAVVQLWGMKDERVIRVLVLLCLLLIDCVSQIASRVVFTAIRALHNVNNVTFQVRDQFTIAVDSVLVSWTYMFYYPASVGFYYKISHLGLWLMYWRFQIYNIQ